MATDISKSLPDPAHEGLRQSVVQAINDMGDGLSLTDVLFELVDVLFLTVDDLTARLDAADIPLI